MGGGRGVELGRTLGGASGRNDWGGNRWGAGSEEKSGEGGGTRFREGGGSRRDECSWGRDCCGAGREEMSGEGRGACLREGSHYRGILPGVCEHRTCDQRQSREGESRPQVLWDARVIGERKLAEEGILVFAAMSGSGFRSPKMSPRTVRECRHDDCTTLGCSTFSPGVMCGGAITKQKVLLLTHSLVIR